MDVSKLTLNRFMVTHFVAVIKTKIGRFLHIFILLILRESILALGLKSYPASDW